MLFTSYVLASALGASTLALAKQIPVQVGQDGMKVFSPDRVIAQAGDEVIFTFVAGNHTVTQSSFADPCTAVPSGADSNFRQPGANGTVRLTVPDSTTPLWFFCKQTGHCQSGMVFSINAPTSGNTADAFKAKALSLAPSGSGAAIPAPAPPSAQPPTGGQQIMINVGQDPTGATAFSFNPPSANAQVGDTIVFVFSGGNHSATQSTFKDPCTPMPDGFDTQFAANTPRTVPFPVTSTAPAWFFCAQTTPAVHCQKGMVFSLNAPATGNTADAFKAAAIATANAPPADAPPQNDPAPTDSASADPNASATPTDTTSAPGASQTSQQFTVMVGVDTTGQTALAFNPPSVKAAVGDTILFTFSSGNHSATQSTFKDPCTPMPGGFDSQFQADTVRTVPFPVTSTSPAWFFCAQTTPAVHCQQGMVFAVNAPDIGNTPDAFKAAAMATAQTPQSPPPGSGARAIVASSTALWAPALAALLFGML